MLRFTSSTVDTRCPSEVLLSSAGLGCISVTGRFGVCFPGRRRRGARLRQRRLSPRESPLPPGAERRPLLRGRAAGLAEQQAAPPRTQGWPGVEIRLGTRSRLAFVMSYALGPLCVTHPGLTSSLGSQSLGAIPGPHPQEGPCFLVLRSQIRCHPETWTICKLRGEQAVVRIAGPVSIHNALSSPCWASS